MCMVYKCVYVYTYIYMCVGVGYMNIYMCVSVCGYVWESVLVVVYWFVGGIDRSLVLVKGYKVWVIVDESYYIYVIGFVVINIILCVLRFLRK